VKTLTRLKLVETSCLSDRTGPWRKNLERGLSELTGKTKDLMWQIRMRKATVLLHKGGSSKKAIALLKKALESVGPASSRTMDLWYVCSLLARAYNTDGSLDKAGAVIQLGSRLLLEIKNRNYNQGTVRTFFRREDVREFLALRKTQKK
jgi:hypothetical protein